MKKAKFVTLPDNTQKIIEHTQKALQLTGPENSVAGYYGAPSVTNGVISAICEGSGELRIRNVGNGGGAVTYVNVNLMNPNLAADDTPQLNSLHKTVQSMGLDLGTNAEGVHIQGEQVANWVKAILKAGFRHYGGSGITPEGVSISGPTPTSYGYGVQ